jgi:hypothetical protein
MSESTPRSQGRQSVQTQHRREPQTIADSTEGRSVLRERFFKRIRQDALKWGGEHVDMAWVYYPDHTILSEERTEETSEKVSEGENSAHPHKTPLYLMDLRLVTDRIFLPKARCFGDDFIDSVTTEWWGARAEVIMAQGESARPAICGFYGRYLSASGFAMVIEFGPDGREHIWRVDARAQGVSLPLPQNEEDFYSQFGTPLDLHYGWRWLLERYIETERLCTAEVEPGYLIGVRRGAPFSEEDPSDREDPEIQEVFSRFDIERFDTLEFLNHEVSERYPFSEERYEEWFPESYIEHLKRNEIELFTLSQSERFFQAIEEVAERRKVEVSLEGADDHVTLTFTRGPWSITRPFALAYLWTLHTGRKYEEGAIEFFRADLERLYSASELYFKLLTPLAEHRLEVSGDHLKVSDSRGAERANIPLLSWSAAGAFDHADGVTRLLRFIGFDAGEWREVNHRLDECPLCDAPARVVRSIRPKSHQVEDVMNASFNYDADIWGYYSLTCPHHQLPIHWADSDTIERGLKAQTHQMIEVNVEVEVEGVSLLWAREITGTLFDPETRESLLERGATHAYAIFPDLIALSEMLLQGHLLDAVRQRASLLADQWGPDRAWPLNFSVDLIQLHIEQ